MKKYIMIAFTALMTLSVLSSCTKDADIAGIEAKLPKLQLSSLGYQQTGPFVISNTILLINFGATTTNTNTGAFKLEILDGTTIVKTVDFASWNGKDASSPANSTVHSISFTTQPSNYPNTTIYTGSILLRLSALGLSSAKAYTVRATAYNQNGTLNSAITQSSFFRTI